MASPVLVDVEPVPTHDASHSVMVLEGVQITNGEPMHPGKELLGWSDGAVSPTPMGDYTSARLTTARLAG